MKRSALYVVAPLVVLAAACGEDPPGKSGNQGAGATGGSTAGTGSSGKSGASGSGVAGSMAGSAPQAGTSAGGSAGANAGAGGSNAGTGGTPSAGSGGSAGVSAGAGGSGGATGGAGASAGEGGSVTAGSGGDAGSSGGGTGGSAGDAGTGGSAGSGGSKLHGGASAAYVCPPGPYGEPLQGMGQVESIGPPTQGQPNYFAFVEGPIWVGSLSKLFFSDNASSPAERIWQVTIGSQPSVFLENSGSNGMALDGDDKLIVADQRGKRITRVDPTSTSPSAAVVLADAGCKPNDVIVRSDGNIYYTAPNENGNGFYRIDPQGTRTGPRTEVTAPNGIVLSPDENTLYVGDVGNRSITAFTLAADGSIGTTGTPFATTTNQTTDGMCVDCAGNVYAGTSNGVEVFSPAGTPIGTVPTGESSNCTFGGTDRKTIFTTSRGVVKSVKLNVPGLPD